ERDRRIWARLRAPRLLAALQPLAASSMSEDVSAFLRRSGLGTPRALQALAGGVSSDIWRADLAAGPVCVKRALPRLRVAQLWEAPIERNRYERQWMQTAA